MAGFGAAAPSPWEKKFWLMLSFSSRQLKAFRRYIKLNPARALCEMGISYPFFRPIVNIATNGEDFLASYRRHLGKNRTSGRGRIGSAENRAADHEVRSTAGHGVRRRGNTLLIAHIGVGGAHSWRHKERSCAKRR